jgi:hypothetical protein
VLVAGLLRVSSAAPQALQVSAEDLLQMFAAFLTTKETNRPLYVTLIGKDAQEMDVPREFLKSIGRSRMRPGSQANRRKPSESHLSLWIEEAENGSYDLWYSYDHSHDLVAGSYRIERTDGRWVLKE